MYCKLLRRALVAPRRQAFTIPEVLAAVAVITILLGFMLPVFSKARHHARFAKELSAVKQLMVGHINFSTNHLGRVIPGYANEPAKDVRGNPVHGPLNLRYPWRIAEWLDHNIEGSLLVNEQEALMKDTTANAYFISLCPSFGMNLYFVGGDLTAPYNKTWVERRHQAYSAARLIVFGSSRFNDTGLVHGFFRIESPRYSPGYVSGWAASYKESDPAIWWGNVHPRWDNRAAFGMLDGHAEALDTTEMRDMTRWSSQAARAGDANWKP